jgi:hypothetical protein
MMFPFNFLLPFDPVPQVVHQFSCSSSLAERLGVCPYRSLCVLNF